MSFEMNEYYVEDGSMKEYDVLSETGVFEESVFGNSADRVRKKEIKKMQAYIRDAILRIMQEIWKLFPRNATIFTGAIKKQKGKWVTETLIYMTKDPKNEKPVKEDSYKKNFNISKEQLSHLKEVCARSLEYVGRNTILDTTSIDIFFVNVFYDGSANYRFGQMKSVAKSNYVSDLVDHVAAIPDKITSSNLNIGDVSAVDTDFEGLL